MKYYPLYLDLNGKKTVVVGSGQVASRKISSLLDAGAFVVIISPSEDIDSVFPESAKIKRRKKEYDKSDLIGATLVFAATDNLELNSQIGRDCKDCGIPVNIAAPPCDSDFIVPSVIARGDLIIAISTSGKSPALSKKIRKDLEENFGEEYHTLIEILGEIRPIIMSKIDSDKKRGEILNKIVNSDILNDIKTEGKDKTLKQIIEIIELG